ncbi:MAG: phosphoadenosine phosphosulfate reductase family protein [Thermoplasmatales archaeon]|nr:phosphoadenosine phosphosulfate reductase family protein [Thermoplasmatales archaeon]
MIYLGKIPLKYCEDCNLPVLKERCSCGSVAKEVKITPPGDVRPSFDFDREMIKKKIIEEFGDYYLPENTILNAIPSIDRSDEVIIDGKVAGIFYYDIFYKKFYFQPRPWYMSLLEIKKGYVIADRGAEEAILKTSNLMAPGIVEIDGNVRKGDEVVILNKEGEVIATGKARMNADEMKRGMAIKVRWRGKEEKCERKEENGWKKIIEENGDVIEETEKKAISFIEKIANRYNIPKSVSFSGGKDSLATLLLAMEGGYDFPMLFIDTGLEFDETKRHVHEVADKFGINLIEESAGNIFWESIDFFGPPARDYRWCCKTCKLGVAGRAIRKNFGSSVLSFIGQRRYESFGREKHGSIWKNPWVHGQIGASPIQNWSAMHVWLYLFNKKVKWNKLYEEGFSRIGCWLCPACDLAEFEIKKHERWDDFNEFLIKFSKKNNLPEEWISLGLWRWREKPKWFDKPYEIKMEREYVIEGNEERIKNFMKMLGEKRNEETVKDLIYRAINCVGCGICVSKCEQGAIYLKDGKAWVNDKCIHCLKCMEECPVIVFR